MLQIAILNPQPDRPFHQMAPIRSAHLDRDRRSLEIGGVVQLGEGASRQIDPECQGRQPQETLALGDCGMPLRTPTSAS